MSFYGAKRLGDFREDTQRAMQTAPNYWILWYSAKSILLVGVAATLAYVIGKNSRGRRSRR